MSKPVNPQLVLPKSRIFEILGNIMAVLLYLNFSIIYTLGYIRTQSLSILLYAAYNTVILFLLFVRKQAKSTSDNFWYWLVAIGGAFVDLLMRPYPLATGLSYWVIIQCIGIIISFAGLVSLNKGFGIMVGNRGIHSGGMYRFIRHPLYTGYLVTVLSFFAQHVSLWNLLIFILFLVFLLTRIHVEENFLLTDPVYIKYSSRTKWRLIPWVW